MGVELELEDGVGGKSWSSCLPDLAGYRVDKGIQSSFEEVKFSL